MEKLTNQEEDIMLRIWRLGRCAVKQIMEQLPEPRPPYTTVASIVNNLKRKEYVKAERDGKGYVYSPLIAESDYKRKFLSGFVNNYFKNSFKEMVSFFAKDEKISPEDLKDIIREIESSEEWITVIESFCPYYYICTWKNKEVKIFISANFC